MLTTTRRVLVLCTHNSARSQMAEGFLRALAGDRLEVASAGTEATRVHPLAIRVMDEVGIDLRGHSSKSVDGQMDRRWDYVITVCDSANAALPTVSRSDLAHSLELRRPVRRHRDGGRAAGGLPSGTGRDRGATPRLAGRRPRVMLGRPRPGSDPWL